MPISPANMLLYPGGSIRSPEWLALRDRVRARAADRCENCGVHNYAVGAWFGDAFIVSIDAAQRGDPITWGGITRPAIKIVCTTAHVDGELVDHSPDNLRFWCQRCHNRHDAPMRAAGRKARA
jgi:5-methylcytosine-specific restriction endonuclease McrA